MQALNRYSYVYNNPLSYTDPSGYGVWSSAFKLGKKIWNLHRSAFKKAWNAHIGRPLKSIVRAISKVEGLQQVISIAITAFVPGCQTGYCAMAFNSAIAAANGGSIADIATAAALAYASIKLAPPAPSANPAGSVLSRLQIKSVGGTVAADEAGDEALKRLASNMLKNQAKAIIDTAEKKAQARPEEKVLIEYPVFERRKAFDENGRLITRQAVYSEKWETIYGAGEMLDIVLTTSRKASLPIEVQVKMRTVGEEVRHDRWTMQVKAEAIFTDGSNIPIIKKPYHYGPWTNTGAHDWQRTRQLMRSYPVGGRVCPISCGEGD